LAVNNGAVAVPAASVVAVAAVPPPANVADGPVLGTVNVTATPTTGFPEASVTVALTGVVKGLVTVVVSWSPAVTDMETGGPATFESVAVVLRPPPLAAKDQVPTVAFAVSVGAVARPAASVVAVAVVPVGKTAEGPLPGALKVTVMPDTGLPAASVARTATALEKALLTAAV
jgi:hypothetical protein